MGRFRLPLSLLVFGAAAYFSASGQWPWHRFTMAPAAALVHAGPAAPAPTESLDTLHAGETVSALFARHNVVGLDLGAVAKKLSFDPRRLRAGLVFNFHHAGADSAPQAISVRTGPEQRVLFRRVAAGWDAEARPIEWRPEVVRVEGDIANSLYQALDAQVPDSTLAGDQRTGLAWALADVYDWQVDFTRDIQPGDHFQVLLERLVSSEGDVRFGRILASDLSVGGRKLTAFHFGGAGATGFYDAQGNSLKLAFLRAPVEFRRISSDFARTRFHPVLGLTRKHEGTDYAAPTGTPVRAAGDGVVLRAGRAGGYGNLIEIRHRNGITTRYGHLSRLLVHAGQHISQGFRIGLVGQTGLATGPHLHYEFRVGGVAQDSRRVNLGNGPPLEGRDRRAFEAERTRLAALLYGPAPVMVAARSS